ncbi:hypothetical protein RQM47_10660 [Rubrivirga sp. S365]|uniref:hypothetical protein n=1 Tax=Rubrivirga sp. S365 TaxID=3076080 RepID=UPI0028C8C6BF|nr:hypothetical protein [Rubrivirga sp. S365]MDT7857103.1 hypothetical protein [Rubrivirga sp. S365]
MDITGLFAIFAVFIGLPWAVFAGIAKVKAANAAGRGGEGTELRASELRAMIEASVEEATAPLVRRIETLEAIATDDEPARAGRLDPATLANVFDTDLDDANDVPAARRRARE